MEKWAKNEMTFQRENVFISILITCTNKWKNGRKEMTFQRENAFISIQIMYNNKRKRHFRQKKNGQNSSNTGEKESYFLLFFCLT